MCQALPELLPIQSWQMCVCCEMKWGGRRAKSNRKRNLNTKLNLPDRFVMEEFIAGTVVFFK